jgi:MFS family permease
MRKLHYAWIMLLLCFLGLLAAQGVRLSFGAFIEPWERTFQVDRSVVSFVSFLSFVVYGLAQPFVGRLVDRYGIRRVLSLSVLLVGVGLLATAFARTPLQLMLIYGVIASLGFGGASGVVASVAVTTWFETRRGLAFGIVEAGFAVGQLVLVPTSLLLIQAWGWQRTMIALGLGLSLVIFPLLLLLLRSTPAEIGAQPYGAAVTPALRNEPGAIESQPAAPYTIFFQRAFWGLALPFFICGITTTGMIDTHLIPFAHDHGYAAGVTGAAVSLLAAFNILGTLASGPLSDRWDNRHILGSLYAIRALSLVLLLTLHQPQWLLAFGVIFGLVDFAVLAPTQLLASRYFEGHSLGFVFGLISLTHQLGSALGAYIPGVLYDLTGSYNLPFAAGAGILVIGALLSFLLPHPNATLQRLPSAVSAA